MAGAANLFIARSPWHPSLLQKKQRHWYKLLDDKDLTSCRSSPEFTVFAGKNLNVVALTSVTFSASEMALLDSLASNILKATSWLNHGLVVIAERFVKT